TESTPPLWYALAWLVHRAGVPLTEVRLVSVLAGCGLAAAVVAAGRYVLPDGAALLAGLLVAVGNEFVLHGHELRAYELLAFLSALLLWLLLREVTAPSRANAVGLGVVVGAGGLTHYFFAPVVLAALLWAAVDPAARVCRRAVVMAIAAALWAGGVHVFALRNVIELGPPVALVAGALVARVAERAGVVAATVVAGVVLVLPIEAGAAEVPPFSGIAHALVAEGWRP